MKIALMVTPMSDHHLRLAAQVGAEEIVAPYPGLDGADLVRRCERVASFGMRVSVIERHVPHDAIVHGLPGRDEQVDGFKTLIRNMGRAGIPTLCYNWMPSDDWTRTSVDTRERGGALVTAFDLAELPDDEATTETGGKRTTSDELWRNLETFLREVVPVAEECGVALALHPDDPPLPRLRGHDQIITGVEAMERAAALVPSPANGLCYCQGTLSSAGEDVIAGIRRLAPHIRFAHFRDVVGTVPAFRESFHDNGQTDMAAAIRAYRDIGFVGPIRPDHAPTLDGETNENPGYEMLGRLYAVGYMRGLIDGTA